MKKLFFALFVVSFILITLASCSSSRRNRTGCPM